MQSWLSHNVPKLYLWAVRIDKTSDLSIRCTYSFCGSPSVHLSLV